MTQALPCSLDAILDALPQTQCQACGYAGCRPYAEAILQGETIDACPPGGVETLERLSALTHRPIDDAQRQRLRDNQPPWQVAHIDPNTCIGCTKCIKVCPVDAIVGTQKQLHDILELTCTGCGLCLPPCPVDCITLTPIEPTASMRSAQSQAAKQLTQRREERLAVQSEKAMREHRRAKQAAHQNNRDHTRTLSPKAQRLTMIQQALARKKNQWGMQDDTQSD